MRAVSRAEAAGAWSQESMEGLRAEAARSAAAARARGGVWRWAAQWGCAGSAAPSASAVTRVRRAWWAPVPWSGMRGPVVRRRCWVTVSGPPHGEGAVAAGGAVVECGEDGVDEGAQVGGACCASGQGRGGHGWCGPSGAWGRSCQLFRFAEEAGRRAQRSEPERGTAARYGGGGSRGAGIGVRCSHDCARPLSVRGRARSWAGWGLPARWGREFAGSGPVGVVAREGAPLSGRRVRRVRGGGRRAGR